MPYTADIDFIISGKGDVIKGKAHITRADVTRLSFSEPEALSSVTISSDNTGNDEILSFELSGIPASAPKAITSDLTLLFSLFSDDVLQKINSIESSSFTLTQEVNDMGSKLIRAGFDSGGMSYTLMYDKHAGLPHSFDAGSDKAHISIIFSNFTKTQSHDA